MNGAVATEIDIKTEGEFARPNYLSEHTVRSWLLTTDHKRIALLYLASVTFFFFVGGFFAVLIRLELLTPQGDLVQAETYNRLSNSKSFSSSGANER